MPIYKITAEQADTIRLLWLETLKEVIRKCPDTDINNWHSVSLKAKRLGLPYPTTLAEQYNVSVPSIFRILRLEQHKLRPYSRSKELKQEAIKLREQGFRCRSIAERLGISVQRSKEITRGYGTGKSGPSHDRKDDPTITRKSQAAGI